MLGDGQVLGVLRRNDLVKALSEARNGISVGDVMCRDAFPVEESAPLASTLEAMGSKQFSTLPVLAGGRMVGLLTLENIGELIMIQSAKTGDLPRIRF